MHTRRVVSAFLLSTAAVPVTWGCSACLKDILSPAEFDERSWTSAAHVFVGLVMAAEIDQREAAPAEISYRVRAEETLKGDASQVRRVYSTRMINEWNGLEEIGCGHSAVAVGDRLLVFADSEGMASLGQCSATRVIEGIDAPPRDEVKATLERLRRWRR